MEILLIFLPRWHQDVKPSNILVKSKGISPYDCEFKLADLGLSHFKKHVPSQGEATDRDTYGTRAYGRLHSNELPIFTVADGTSGAPECYRADCTVEKTRLSVNFSVDMWSLGCVFSEAAVWVVRGKYGLSEYRRRRGMETARIPGFRDGDCFHDGQRVLAIVTKTHRDLADEIRFCDHVTGATVEMVTKEMLGVPDTRLPAKYLIHPTQRILRNAETKLRRPASFAGTGSVSGTDGQSPPRTPPEPPPGHVRPRSGNSQNQRTSYDGDEFHHQEPGDEYFGKRASQQAHHSDWPTQQQSTGLANHPSYTEHKDHLTRASTEVGLSRVSPSSPSWRGPLSRTPPALLSRANTRNRPETFPHPQQETYDVSLRDPFTAPPRTLRRTSTVTLIQDRHYSSRAGQHDPNIASGTRPPRLVSNGLSNPPPPMGTQPRRPPPFLSVTTAQQWKGDKKEHRAATLPDDHLLAHLNEVDSVFLIDNSHSMRPSRKEVEYTFSLLGYIVKGTDPDGIEIRFTMSPNRNDKARNTAQLLRTLVSVPYFGTSNIRTALGEILQDYQGKLRDQKPTRSLFNRTRSPRLVRRQNVYVFTDGVWHPGCDPTQLIKNLVDSLQQNSMVREQFGIQFIRFGNDPDGVIRLNQLDSGLGLSMDIVDTEPSNGNVWKMLLGASNVWFDDDDVNANSSAVASPNADASPGTNGLHNFGRRFTHT